VGVKEEGEEEQLLGLEQVLGALQDPSAGVEPPLPFIAEPDRLISEGHEQLLALIGELAGPELPETSGLAS
jgi:hypothetical protein